MSWTKSLFFTTFLNDDQESEPEIMDNSIVYGANFLIITKKSKLRLE